MPLSNLCPSFLWIQFSQASSFKHWQLNFASIGFVMCIPFFLYMWLVFCKDQSVEPRSVISSCHQWSWNIPFSLVPVRRNLKSVRKKNKVSQSDLDLNTSFAFAIVWLLDIYLHITEPKPFLSNWAVILPILHSRYWRFKDNIGQKRILLLSSTHNSCLYMMSIKLVLSNNKLIHFYVDHW